MMLDEVSAKVGDILVFSPRRDFPGIVISDSAGVALEHVTLHHCGGMGVIAQRSADLSLSHVKVTPPVGGKRVVSLTADATHFVNCRGKIEMTDCLFENQKDDATNVHGLTRGS
uniref:CAZy families GH110 protein n=1 Tax=uncultured Shewanella sp. TaxID=173975 RepID=A0A060CEU4_9GAMM|nr:CAZy families GH110 protein [uncultured Shewanella sp.]